MFLSLRLLDVSVGNVSQILQSYELVKVYFISQWQLCYVFVFLPSDKKHPLVLRSLTSKDC